MVVTMLGAPGQAPRPCRRTSWKRTGMQCEGHPQQTDVLVGWHGIGAWGTVVMAAVVPWIPKTSQG